MKIKLSKTQWEETGRKAGWIKQAQEAHDWYNPGPIEAYTKKCVDGMIDLRGGISRQNAAGQLAHYVQLYYDHINKIVNRNPSSTTSRNPDDLIGQKGLCPICGKMVTVINVTKDGRPIGSCQDAFTIKQWIKK